MAHSYFADSDTPSIYGTRKRKSPAAKRKRIGNPVDFGKAKKRASKLRGQVKSSRTSGPLSKLGGMHDRTADPFGRRR